MPNPRARASRTAGIFGADDDISGGVLRTCSDTCLAVGGVPENPNERGSRAVGRSDTVFARDGADADIASLLGGRGSGLLKPKDLGSRMGAVAVRANPILLGSEPFGGVTTFFSVGSDLSDCESCCAFGGLGGDPTLSSLLGGVENGLNLASDDGLRGVG